ncbi:hypothetical protein GF362_03530 [Candidatus Dojkabacteria bacterium]|nr:hypothetical protein [Candidatus Dojkabacteria bacterium]
MKKFILYFITNISAIWITKLLFSGFQPTSAVAVLWLSALLLGGMVLNEAIASKIKGDKLIFFFFIGTLVTFFILYLGSLFIPNFAVHGGSLPIKIIKQADQILTLLLASASIMITTSVAKWASSGGGSKE